jgi:hypothetical protein
MEKDTSQRVRQSRSKDSIASTGSEESSITHAEGNFRSIARKSLSSDSVSTMDLSAPVSAKLKKKKKKKSTSYKAANWAEKIKGFFYSTIWCFVLPCF